MLCLINRQGYLFQLVCPVQYSVSDRYTCMIQRITNTTCSGENINNTQPTHWRTQSTQSKLQTPLE